MTGFGLSIDGDLAAGRKDTRSDQATAREKQETGRVRRSKALHAMDTYLLFSICEPRQIVSESDGVEVGTKPLDVSGI